MGILLRAAVTAIAIAVAAFFVPGIHWGAVDYGLGDPGRYLSLLFTAIVLGILNAFVKPILVLISLPLTCATLGLFMFVINAVMLLLVAAIIGSIVISLVSAVLSKVVP